MGSKIPCVASDNFAGGQLAAEKLADLGCTNVAFLRIGSSLDNDPNKFLCDGPTCLSYYKDAPSVKSARPRGRTSDRF